MRTILLFASLLVILAGCETKAQADRKEADQIQRMCLDGRENDANHAITMAALNHPLKGYGRSRVTDLTCQFADQAEAVVANDQ